MIGTLQTPRLLLRPLAHDDWRSVHAYASDAAVMRYVPGGALSEDQVRAIAGENEGDAAMVAAVLTLEERVIGHLPFHAWYAPRIYEIGWVFHPRYQGRGYATEAAAALLRHGFGTLGLHRVVATCQPENVASWRVMEKIGLRREAHFRKCFQVDETSWLDEYLYALVEDDWYAERGTTRDSGSGPAPSTAGTDQRGPPRAATREVGTAEGMPNANRHPIRDPVVASS